MAEATLQEPVSEVEGGAATPLPDAVDPALATVDAEAEVTTEGEPEALPEVETKAEADDVWTVKVEGQEAQLPRAEIIAGYQKGVAAARTWSQANQIKAQATAEIEAARAVQEQYVAKLREIAAAPSDEQEPDWAKLAEEDPAGCLRKQIEWNAKATKRAKAQQEADAVEERAWTEHLAAQRKRLPHVIPEWKDSDTREKERLEVAHYAVEQGMDPRAVANADDPVIIAWARKAMLFDRAEAARKAAKPAPKPVLVKTAAAPTIAPGARQTPTGPAAQIDPRAKLYPSMFS